MEEINHMFFFHRKSRRGGFNYLKRLLEKTGTNIIVVNETKEDEHELMKDFIAVMTSFCCRLYGLRRCKNKVEKIKKEILID